MTTPTPATPEPTEPPAERGAAPLIVARALAHVPYGPSHVTADEADADYLRAAVRNIKFSRCMGSNLTATVAAILTDLAEQIEARVTPPGKDQR